TGTRIASAGSMKMDLRQKLARDAVCACTTATRPTRSRRAKSKNADTATLILATLDPDTIVPMYRTGQRSKSPVARYVSTTVEIPPFSLDLGWIPSITIHLSRIGAYCLRVQNPNNAR